MFEVLKWVSIAALWLCIALNVRVMVSGARLNKCLKAERKYHRAMINAYEEFLKANRENSESAEENTES